MNGHGPFQATMAELGNRDWVLARGYFCGIIDRCVATHCHRPALLINMSVH